MFLALKRPLPQDLTKGLSTNKVRVASAGPKSPVRQPKKGNAQEKQENMSSVTRGRFVVLIPTDLWVLRPNTHDTVENIQGTGSTSRPLKMGRRMVLAERTTALSNRTITAVRKQKGFKRNSWFHMISGRKRHSL